MFLSWLEHEKERGKKKLLSQEIFQEHASETGKLCATHYLLKFLPLLNQAGDQVFNT